MFDKTCIVSYAVNVLRFPTAFNIGVMNMGLPVGTFQRASASYLDAGDENGTMSIYGKVITAGNEVAQAATWATLLGAIDALALGNRRRDTYNDETTYDVVAPTNGAARELCLKVRFHDTVNGQQWLQTVVPTLDSSLIEYISGGKDIVDMTTMEVADLITALEAFPVVNPYAQANAVEVLAVYATRGQK